MNEDNRTISDRILFGMWLTPLVMITIILSFVYYIY